MKKFIAFLIIAAMMISAVLPVSAADGLTAAEENEILQAYFRNYWDRYLAEYADSFDMTYEKYVAGKTAEDVELFEYRGRYGENQSPVMFISAGMIFGRIEIFIGDYYFDFGHYDAEDYLGGLFIYENGELTLVSEAYAKGMVTDDDLKAMHDSGNFDDMMRRIGDMDQNKSLDVGDIVALKEHILKSRYNNHDFIYSRHYGDFNKDGFVNVGDILALKNYIMSK